MKNLGDTKLNYYLLIDLVFLMYFCDKAFASVVFRVLGVEAINLSFIIVFALLLFLYLCSYKNAIFDLIVPVIVYLIVFLVFFFTSLIHPEYESWFTHPLYGIGSAIINPRAALWAFLIVWLIKDERRLFIDLKVVAWVGLIFYGLQFVAAFRRGYWVEIDVNGEIEQLEYNLEFGYDVLFPVAFMGANAFLNNKKIYYIPYAIGVMMILFGGSRGALLWAIALFPLMIPFKWRNMNTLGRILFSGFIILLIAFAGIVLLRFDAFISLASSVFSKIGISSRTLTALLEGTISDDNGRGEIYKMALELIRNGGLFGWGVYGDRYVIGNKFKWGYSHNLFLELFVSFGYVGGAVLCILLIVGIIKLYRICDNKRRQIVFMTFFATAFKLMLSNSFWYSEAFWALLAIMIMWKKEQKTYELSTLLLGYIK